ncbi:hypothetical protein K3495_g14836 [Podosphaera aphanis]|nr:hypothetical protein K3495_g14836 [Podosphaera aphanis]
MNSQLVRKHGLKPLPLEKPRPFFLADGKVSELITHSANDNLQIGDHFEKITVLLTILSSDTDLVLGFPWFQKHNTQIDWINRKICLNSTNCHHNCRQMNLNTRNFDINTDLLQTSMFTKHRYQSPALTNTTEDSTVDLKINEKEILLELNVSLAKDLKPLNTDNQSTTEPTNLDIAILGAPNFMKVVRQEGVRVMRVFKNELEMIDTSVEPLQLPSSLCEIDFRDLVTGQGDLSSWKNRMPEQTHSFLDYCFSEKAALLSKISDTDVRKIFNKLDGPAVNEEEIKSKLPPEYHDLWKVALPQDATDLPPHRSYDHKIELIPGNYKTLELGPGHALQ